MNRLTFFVVRIFIVVLPATGLAACGGGDEAPVPEGRSAEQAVTSKAENVRLPSGLKGTLIFERNEPLKQYQVMRMNMRSGRFEVAAEGWDASMGDKSMSFLQLCSPLAVRAAVTDEDGFSSPVSECFERATITPDFYRSKMSPDDKLIAVANSAILLPKDELPDTAAARYGIGDNTYVATQIYSVDGELVAELRDFGVGEWTHDGDLVVAGAGGDVGYGLFRVDSSFGKPERIDDGRIREEVISMDTHPSEDRVVFIYNGQIFEMDMTSGAPKRIHSHGYPLSSVAYSPDGDDIVFVSNDPLDEAIETPGNGYHMFVLREGDVEMITVPFIPGGPLDWVD